jgi:hypothetical protein
MRINIINEFKCIQMKRHINYYLFFLLFVLLYSCSNDKPTQGTIQHEEGTIMNEKGANTGNESGNGAVLEGSNKDDYYQMRGYGDSIPSDSIRKAKTLDSIRIANSPNHNK